MKISVQLTINAVLKLTTCITLQKALMESQQNQSDCGVGGCHPLDVLISTLCSHLMQACRLLSGMHPWGRWLCLQEGNSQRESTRELPAQPSLKLRGDLGETPALTSEITMIATED